VADQRLQLFVLEYFEHFRSAKESARPGGKGSGARKLCGVAMAGRR
jgi:hypothetical protein